MSITRQRFDLRGATGGTWSDTGPAIVGALVEGRYIADTGDPLDTGANISLAVLTPAIDLQSQQTTSAFTLQTTRDMGQLNSGGDWSLYPNDTGSGGARPPFFANERLRVQVTQDSGSSGGTFMAYFLNDD